MIINVVLWTATAFIAGAIPFSLLIGRLALQRDIREVGDGNPGATNVLRSGGKVWALVAAVLDMTKAALPVALAYVIWDWKGPEIVPVAIAPLLGHLYTPFLKGKGGKGVAVTGGIWIGLTYGIGGAVGTAFLSLGYLLQQNPGWAVVCGMGAILGYLLIWQPPRPCQRPDPVLLTIWVLNTLIVLGRHHHDLAHPPVARRWLRHLLVRRRRP